MAEKIRWGILGCAAIAEKAFIPAIKKSKQAELVAIASHHPERARLWAGRFGLKKSYGSYEELLSDGEIQAVYNPLPNHLHRPYSIQALRSGKHVLCEKPLALNAAEVQEMFTEAERNNRVLMEGFMYRFHPQMTKTMELIHEGAIGQPLLVRSAFTFVFDRDRSNYRWSPEMGGGALYDVGCYTINAARLVFQSEPEEIRVLAHLDNPSGIDLTTSLLCAFPGCRQALLTCSFELEFQSILEISGNEGRIFMSRAFSAKNFKTEVQLIRKNKINNFTFQPYDQFKLMIEHFNQAVLGQTNPLIDFNDSYGNALVIEKALKLIQQK